MANKIASNVTEKVRSELNNTSNLIVDQTAALVQSVWKGSKQSEYIANSSKSFATKEIHINQTNNAVNQMEVIQQELRNTYLSTERHMETISQTNQLLERTLTQLNRFREAVQEEQQQQKQQLK
jgi:hypothetical protein